MLMHMAELGAILVAAMMGAVGIIALLQTRQTHNSTHNPIINGLNDGGMVFLFDGEVLIDATIDACAMVSHGTSNLSDLDALMASVAHEFPRLKEKLVDPAATETRVLSENDPAVFVEIKRSNRRLRIALNADEAWTREMAALRMSCDASNAETALMRQITMHSPQLIWQNDQHGNLLWANDAYAKTLRDLAMTTLVDGKEVLLAGKSTRISVLSAADEPLRWFDISTVPHADGVLHFANDVSEGVHASTAKKEVVETLGRTFAELSIGLAIFDKSRQLTIFNPAFLDMTNLPIDFLTGSPTIDTLLDRLRELRMMPEPKNYISWREQFTAVEKGAKEGTYSEHWTLADGQTYRVTGRPYPDGAFALLFEDISAEVSLTRRFRLDIETGQAVLDTLSDAIAVFSATGTLVMSNLAYAKLWSDGPQHILEHRMLPSEMKAWQDQCIPTPMWNDMRDFIQQLGARQPWSDDAMLDDGRRLHCNANRIAGGMTMVRFAIAQPKRPEIRKLMLQDRTILASKR